MKAITNFIIPAAQRFRASGIAAPAPGPEEVLIKVHAAAVNPSRLKIRAGYMKEFSPLTCRDLADVSERLKRWLRAARFKRGDEVLRKPGLEAAATRNTAVAKKRFVAAKPGTVRSCAGGIRAGGGPDRMADAI